MTKKKVIAFGVLYYALVLAVFAAYWWITGCLVRTDEIGAVVAMVYATLFVGTPIAVAILMRFSLLKWYVDPIAAAVPPLYFFLFSLAGEIKRGADLKSAILLLGNDLGDDGGTGWGFLALLFLVGLVASFSIARKKGKSISYRLLEKLYGTEK